MRYSVLLAVCVLSAAVGCRTRITFDELRAVTRASPTPAPIIVGHPYKCGDLFIHRESGVELVVLPFQWSNGDYDYEGHVEIVKDNKAGGTAPEVHFDNACLGIIAPKSTTIKELTLSFGDYGGNINLIENGTAYNEQDFALISSPGISVTPLGGPLGVLRIARDMHEFYFAFPPSPGGKGGVGWRRYSAVVGGGQELWIDDLTFWATR